MPQLTPDTLDRRLRGLQRTNVPKVAAGEANQYLLDRAHAHREMEPVKDMARWLSRRGAYQVGKDGLAVTNHDYSLARAPTLGTKRGAPNINWLTGEHGKRVDNSRPQPLITTLGPKHSESGDQAA